MLPDAAVIGIIDVNPCPSCLSLPLNGCTLRQITRDLVNGTAAPNSSTLADSKRQNNGAPL